MRLADYSIRRPVFAAMLIAALLALGLISLGRLGVDLMPRVEFPYVAITTILEGATPETVETELTDVIEEHVNTISGIEELRSVSSEGLSQVFVRFELEEDVDAKAQDVRDQVALARPKLPLAAEPPVIQKLDPAAAPILSVMVAGDRPLRELTSFADDVAKGRLQRVPGVGSVTRVGGREREVRIWIDAERLRSYGLAVDDVIRAVRSEHAEVPGGLLEVAGRRAEFAIKTKGEVEAVQGFGDLVIAYRGDGPTRLRDVARVEDGLEDERSYAELDGLPGVSLDVRRQSGRNTVEVARAVKAAVAGLREELPPGMRIAVARDVSRFIEASARDVGVDMMMGGILAVVVTLAFLRSIRSTLIVATAIPTAIVSTFFLFYLMDFTLNLLTLMALSVSIGLLIDDAIVVLESIHRRIEAGEPPLRAASLGTAEVGSAVIAGTASVLAVFVPIAFMRGMIGRFFYEYGLAISFAVAVSLLVAVTLTPTLCSRALRAGGTAGGPVFSALDRAYARLERGYARLLAASLRHRALVIALAGASVVVGIGLARTVPLDFGGKTDRSEFEALVELPFGAGLEETKQVGRRVAAAIGGVADVQSVFLTVGGGAEGQVSEARLYVDLTDKQVRERSQLLVMEEVRSLLLARAPEAKGISVSEVPWVSGGGFTAYHMEYGVQGPDLARLESLGSEIAARMRSTPVFRDVKSSFELGKPELQVRIDRGRAADLGVTVRSLANALRALVGGVDVASYEESGSRYDVRVRLEEPQRDDMEDLARIQVRAADERLVDLANLARFRVQTGPARILRRDRARKLTLFANIPEGVALGEGVEELDAIVAEVGLPSGYLGRHEAYAERMQETTRSVLFAFLLALLALYMILASQFNSFVQPAVIMLSAPLSFVGAFAALVMASTPLSVFAQIGLVALMGLVMKNGILLVDYANQQRAEGAGSHEAILRAGPVRLRPVLMTALSTIFGMIPVAISTSDAAELRNPMGILVIGGLCSSTFLTLLVVPVAYTLVDDLRALPERLRAALARGRSRRTLVSRAPASRRLG